MKYADNSILCITLVFVVVFHDNHEYITYGTMWKLMYEEIKLDLNVLFFVDKINIYLYFLPTLDIAMRG